MDAIVIEDMEVESDTLALCANNPQASLEKQEVVERTSGDEVAVEPVTGKVALEQVP